MVRGIHEEVHLWCSIKWTLLWDSMVEYQNCLTAVLKNLPCRVIKAKSHSWGIDPADFQSWIDGSQILHDKNFWEQTACKSWENPKALKLWKLVVLLWGPFQSGVKVICMVFKKWSICLTMKESTIYIFRLWSFGLRHCLVW